MAIKKISKVFSKNPDVTALQENLAGSIQDLGKSAFLNGVFIDFNITSIGTDFKISHLLKRKIKGWTVTRLKGQATLYESPTTNTQEHLFLILRSTAAVHGTVFIF